MTKTGSFPENHKRIAVIIGASSGIGKALASELSREGWRLALAARRMDLLEKIAADCGPATLIRRVDLMESEKAAAAIESLLDELGTVDLFIISAGTGHINSELEWARTATRCLSTSRGSLPWRRRPCGIFFGKGMGIWWEFRQSPLCAVPAAPLLTRLRKLSSRFISMASAILPDGARFP